MKIPSPSSVVSFCASVAGTWMVIRPVIMQIIPKPLLNHIISFLDSRLRSGPTSLTIVLEDNRRTQNVIYDAAEIYLSSKLSPDTVTASRLKISRNPKSNHTDVYLTSGETFTDLYQDAEITWRFTSQEIKTDIGLVTQRQFELTFSKRHKELIFDLYVPYVLSMAKNIEEQRRMLKMYTLRGFRWGEPVYLEHPSTFRTIAMENELKKAVMADLDLFVQRREFYKRVGKAWKRGYLLYGPPGTGKSSLVAAMANHLRFDIFDLQLGSVKQDADLRSLLLATNNRSILVIEDIDCAGDIPSRLKAVESSNQVQGQLTLAGVLNFIDGLWSSCGDERIIVLTTNHRERLDPALLRPGRMDMQIHLGYCTFEGFQTLASNYLELPCSSSAHLLYGQIGNLLDGVKVTPAEVAGELMKPQSVTVVLEGLVKFLEQKRTEGQIVSSAEEKA